MLGILGMAPHAFMWPRSRSASYALSATMIVPRLRSARSGSAPVRSWACPGVIRSWIGLPWQSTRAWIFVLRPPRLRPTQRSPLFFDPGGVLVNTHDRTVDHLHFAAMGLGHGVHQPVPDPGLAPPVEAIVGGRIRPVALRQIAPWRSSS